jgi:hypothetical protein
MYPNQRDPAAKSPEGMPARQTSAEQLQDTRAIPRHEQRPDSNPFGIDREVVPTATIPWQSAWPQVSAEANYPGGTACPPVHRNGAQCSNTLCTYSTLEADP